MSFYLQLKELRKNQTQQIRKFDHHLVSHYTCSFVANLSCTVKIDLPRRERTDDVVDSLFLFIIKFL